MIYLYIENIHIYICGNAQSLFLELIIVTLLSNRMGFSKTTIRDKVVWETAAEEQLIVQMNQLSRCLIRARQRKSFGEGQGSEALTANVSIGEDWEHWCLLAQGSPANPGSVPAAP